MFCPLVAAVVVAAVQAVDAAAESRSAVDPVSTIAVAPPAAAVVDAAAVK